MLYGPKKGKKTFAALTVMLLIMASIPILMPQKANALPAETMRIVPVQNNFFANQTLPGARFVVNATLTDVTDMYSWQTTLTYDPAVIICTNITIPTGSVYNLEFDIPPQIDNPVGNATIGSSQIVPNTVNYTGSDVLASYEFEIVALGTSHINYSDSSNTFLLDDLIHEIPANRFDASFAYIDPLMVSITPSTTQAVDFGGSAIYTAAASNGAPPYTLQWFFKYPNGTEIEVTAAFNLTTWETYPILVSGSHIVTVQATDSLATAVNASAVIQLRTLGIILNPQSPIVDVGGSVHFTVTITGGVPPRKIQWFRNNTVQAADENLTEVTYTFPLIGIENIKVQVTDKEGTLREASTTTTLLPPATTILEFYPLNGTSFFTNLTKVGDIITLNVTVENIVNLNNWQINVTWDPTFLNLTSPLFGVVLPPDHVFADAIAHGRSIQVASNTGDLGTLIFGATYIGDQYTFNGTGRLCQIKFQIMRYPEPSTSSFMNFTAKYSDTFLVDWLGSTIPMTLENIPFSYTLAPHVTHSILGGVMETWSNASILVNAITANTADTSISFNVAGNPGSVGYVNITIPKNLLFGPWLGIFVNGTDIRSQAIIVEDTANTYIYFTFTFSSTASIRIKGTGIVPEQSFMLLLALMIASLIAVIMIKGPPRRKWTR